MNIINGILAASLAFTGGTGLALFSDKDTPNQNTVIQEQSGNYDQMVELMESGDVGSMQKYMEEGNMNFGQMKPYMSEMHPNLNNQQLEEMYKGMHGTGGSSQSSNFREMGNL